MKQDFGRWVKTTASVLVSLSLVGCAVGNRYDYAGSIGGLPISGTGKIALAVTDARPYVLSGEKESDFVGLQRGGFGNPFDVRTGSGKPLATEMRDAIAAALVKQGFTVGSPTDPAPRKLELRVLEWKTDVMMKMKILYDLELSVFDQSGAVLAQKTTRGEDVSGGGFESQNASNAARTFEMRFTQLMRDADIVRALTASPN